MGKAKKGIKVKQPGATAASQQKPTPKKANPIKKASVAKNSNAPKIKIFYNDAEKLKALAESASKSSAAGSKSRVIQPAKAQRAASNGKIIVSKPKVKPPGQQVNLKSPVAAAPRNIGVSIKTAEAIARDASHPNRGDVAELLKTFERGWIDANKFCTLLSKFIA